MSTAREVLEHASAEVDAALWSAVRALGDRAGTLETLAADNERMQRPQTAREYARLASETRTHAELVRQFVIDVLKLEKT